MHYKFARPKYEPFLYKTHLLGLIVWLAKYLEIIWFGKFYVVFL
jgi:hypothetical protein